MIPYTFKIGSTSYKSLVKLYSYQTDRIPVETERITTMDGVDHVAVKRYKGVLMLEINPTDQATFAAFCDELDAGILSITYTCLQTNTDVTQSMTVSGMPGKLAIKNHDRKVINGLSLTFTQL